MKMAIEPVLAFVLGPSAITIHDDGDMAGQHIWYDLVLEIHERQI
jgi:hypothetical protein